MKFKNGIQRLFTPLPKSLNKSRKKRKENAFRAFHWRFSDVDEHYIDSFMTTDNISIHYYNPEMKATLLFTMKGPAQQPPLSTQLQVCKLSGNHMCHMSMDHP